MFVGHFAVALAAKRVEPRLGLPVLMLATQFLDVLWPVLVVLGVEHARIVPGFTAAVPLDLYDMPYSHSLLTSIVWSVLCALPWWLRRKRRAALVIAGCVFSHFVLDWVTHVPDLPLAPGSSVRFGLGLWRWLVPALLVETALFVGSIWLYVSSSRATSRMGSVGFWALMLFLSAGWLSSTLGPPPPSIQVVVYSALVMLPLILLWSWGIERGRTSVPPGTPRP